MQINEFHYTTSPQEVIFGAGSISRLGEAVKGHHWQRPMLCTTRQSRSRGHVAPIEDTLAGLLAITYEQVEPHVPEIRVAEAVALAAEHKIDAVIGLGGGSSIGMAKAISRGLHEQGNNQSFVPIIAIPTTYAGSEMTSVYGITHYDGKVARKITVTDPRILPQLVLYDPLLTLNLSPEMTASTAINALAHCIEALYSISRNPLSTAIALRGIHSIWNSLPRCYASGNDIEARTALLTGAFLAGTALAHVDMALHHGICHVLGGTAGVPHGIANSIMLPHVMRYNLDATVYELFQAAAAMGLLHTERSPEVIAEEAIQSIYDLISSLNLPQHLGDVGVHKDDLPQLAQIALKSKAVQSNPRPITEASQIMELLQAAWKEGV
jgi:maleylacetate reductase